MRTSRLTPDQITNLLGAIAALTGTLSSLGIYPKTTGAIAAITGSLVAWFVGKSLPTPTKRR